MPPKKKVGGPGKELHVKGQPIKHSCSDIFRTVNNSETLSEQNVFIFTRPSV